MKRVRSYINDSLEELRHIRWPTRQQAIRFSGVVLAFTAVCAVIFGLVDLALTEGLQFILSFA